MLFVSFESQWKCFPFWCSSFIDMTNSSYFIQVRLVLFSRRHHLGAAHKFRHAWRGLRIFFDLPPLVTRDAIYERPLIDELFLFLKCVSFSFRVGIRRRGLAVGVRPGEQVRAELLLVLEPGNLQRAHGGTLFFTLCVILFFNSVTVDACSCLCLIIPVYGFFSCVTIWLTCMSLDTRFFVLSTSWCV